ncbi:MAG: threonylcarbamoyl-AMP synthase [Ruminococcaceae bacterium]|nr:threonylcarbamoyl-AMP synthase [Oscillospiraceae bacterium]
MVTEVLKPSMETLKKAAELIKNGEVVGIPTETVYGLAANAYDSNACAKIFEAKGRPQDNPLIIHISSLTMLKNSVREIPPLALILADNFWSGPLTMIFPKKDIVPDTTSGGLDTVAVRMPDNEDTLNLIEMCGFPLAAPSANLSGSPSPTSATHVFQDMNGRIPLIIDGGECEKGVESTVICFTDNGKGVKILRPGAVTEEMLSRFCEVETDKNVFAKPMENEKVISPGVKYKHYSPKAKIVIVETDNDKAFADFLNSREEENLYGVIFGNEKDIKVKTMSYGITAEEQAHNLFAVLRRTDELGADIAYVRCPEKKGVGTAVYNRLLRAAAFNVIKL